MGIEWLKIAELGLSNIPSIAALINGPDKKKREQLVKDIIQEVELLRVENRRMKKRQLMLGVWLGVNSAVTLAVVGWILFSNWHG